MLPPDLNIELEQLAESGLAVKTVRDGKPYYKLDKEVGNLLAKAHGMGIGDEKTINVILEMSKEYAVRYLKTLTMES